MSMICVCEKSLKCFVCFYGKILCNLLFKISYVLFGVKEFLVNIYIFFFVENLS